MLIFIDFDHLEEPKQKKVQDVLNGMDVPKYSGQPKVDSLKSTLAQIISVCNKICRVLVVNMLLKTYIIWQD